jgi:NAD(P)-dependent dehydrogenase (short-subunit alcohol dehydrogenase family)
MRLQGQLALVTGGSRGIGVAIAETVAAKGADIVVNHSGGFTGVAAGDAAMRPLTVMTPLRKLATPNDVACVVAFVASDDAGFITGHHFFVDGGAAI